MCEFSVIMEHLNFRTKLDFFLEIFCRDFAHKCPIYPVRLEKKGLLSYVALDYVRKKKIRLHWSCTSHVRAVYIEGSVDVLRNYLLI